MCLEFAKLHLCGHMGTGQLEELRAIRCATTRVDKCTCKSSLPCQSHFPIAHRAWIPERVGESPHWFPEDALEFPFTLCNFLTGEIFAASREDGMRKSVGTDLHPRSSHLA